MSKQEFLDVLRTVLSARLDAVQIQENIDYYETYINAQIRQGRSEEDVLKELGDPRLIGKSILEAAKHAQGNEADSEEQNDEMYGDKSRTYGMGGSIVRFPVWAWVIIAFVVIFLVVALFSIVAWLIWWLAPIALVIWFVVTAVRLFQKKN